MAEEAGVDTTKYLFLLTGPVAVGKSTTVAHFRSLRSFDEWLGPRHTGMEKDPSLVGPDTRRAIDQWVAKQLNLKNLAMLDAKSGIYIVDRAPLDAFAFTPNEKWQERARSIRATVSPGKSNRKLVPAHIILMTGDPEVMAVRAISKHKVTDGSKLDKQQESLRSIYCPPGSNTSVIDTRDKTISQVVKEVAMIIHRSTYSPQPLHEWLDKVADGPTNA